MTTNPQTYTIAPLVWIYSKRRGQSVADTILGELVVKCHRMSSGRAWCGYSDSGGSIGIKKRTREAAELAAESWHRERILPALIPVKT